MLSQCLALVAPSTQAGAEELGRLFFTPEERAALDARRKTRLPDKGSERVVGAPTIRMDGYVKRSGSRSTVWVNGEAVRTPLPLPDTGAAPVTVKVGEGTFVQLKPGETLDRATRAVTDVIGDGRIIVPPER